MGAASTRHSLRPLPFEGDVFHSSGRFMPREREAMSPRHCEQSEAIHKSIRGNGLDCFGAALLAMTAC